MRVIKNQAAITGLLNLVCEQGGAGLQRHKLLELTIRVFIMGLFSDSGGMVMHQPDMKLVPLPKG